MLNKIVFLKILVSSFTTGLTESTFVLTTLSFATIIVSFLKLLFVNAGTLTESDAEVIIFGFSFLAGIVFFISSVLVVLVASPFFLPLFAFVTPSVPFSFTSDGVSLFLLPSLLPF